MINSKILAETFLKLFKSDNADKKIDSLFYYLREKNLLLFLPQVKRYILQKQKSLDYLNKVCILSRFSISKQEKDEIIRIVGAPIDVLVEFIQDEDIIGGFQVIYREKIYDGSIFHKVGQLENTLIQF